MEIHIRLRGGKKVDAEWGAFRIQTDQPVAAGGEDSAPSPFDVFLASIGACAGYFVQSYCQTRNLSTAGLEIVQTMEWNHETHRVTKVRLELRLPADFPEKYRPSLASTVNLCTVKKHLQAPPEIETVTTVCAAEPAPLAAAS